MEDTKVQIGDDCLLDLGVNSEWYISTLCYDNESVNVELRRKADRYSEWWRAEQTEPNSSEKPNNCEPKPCEWCKFYDGENCFSQEPCKVMLYFKDEPQTERRE